VGLVSGEWDREVELMNEESGRVRIVQVVKSIVKNTAYRLHSILVNPNMR
jgi:hypothetical protein